MAYAYILSPGKEKETALQSVKVQFKECTELMCALESKLEELMGTLLFEMKGIQGFARICCGDIFEVVIKHGEQKWKSRGRVVKNGEQLWENKYFLFKSLFSDPLCIKAVEVRGLGKNILIGSKFCETRDLFSVHPQQMTINLNSSGSLKLNLIITWNPLNSAADGMNTSTLPSSLGLPYSCGPYNISQSSIQEAEALSELSLSAKEGLLHSADFCDKTGQSLSSESTSASAQSSAVASPDVEVMNRTCLVDSDFIHSESNSVIIPSHLMPQDFNFIDSSVWSVPAGAENSEYHSFSSSEAHLNCHNLTKVLKNLFILLEDVSESYPEVKDFISVLEEIDKFLKQSTGSTSGSNISISIESALGCFDFLNTAIENEDFDGNDKVSEDNSMKVSEQSSSSDVNMAAEDNQELTSKCDSNSLCISSGSEQIDIILSDHLLYCTKLISISVGGNQLVCAESSALMKLRKQTSILSTLLCVMKKSGSFDISDTFEENKREVQLLWMHTAGDVLYCTAEHLYSGIGNIIKSKAVLDSSVLSIVCSRLICEILDSCHYDAASRVSVFQFKAYFSSCSSPDSFLHDFIAETLAVEDLKSRNVEKVVNAVSMLSTINPSCYSLQFIGSLLNETNEELKHIATHYFQMIESSQHLKKEAFSACLEMLLSGTVSSRLTACAVLELLNARNCSEQLLYVAENDDDESVRKAANNVLCRFGKIRQDSSS